MRNRWRIEVAASTLLLLLTVCAACPDELKDLCQCDDYVGGAIIVQCHNANFSVVMAVLNRAPSPPLEKLIFQESVIPILRSKDLGAVSVRSLYITNCSLGRIETGAFNGQAGVLEELILANNSLVAWPPLGNMAKLKSVDLSGNNLTEVREKAFAGMPNLAQLRLRRNHICQLSRNALNETKDSLELLDLSNNCLSSVPAPNLRGASRLTYLDLSGNRIGDMPNMQFMNLPMLKEVRLNSNAITRLSAMAFMNVPELQYLFVRDNRISAIDGNRFQGFRKLEVLDLSGNLIPSVPTASFKEMGSLKQLFLDYNPIQNIDTLAFSSNPKLQIISLQNNRLRTLSRNAFDSLDQMVVLILANNSLTDVDRGMFDGMRNLQQLSLRNNSISRIGNGSFNAVPMLTSLDLSYNMLTSIPKDAFVAQKELFWLDLSNNRLQTFTEGTFGPKVSNILLDNNPLMCDNKLDWFIRYLVVNNVRTFLPYQQEVVCAGPKEYAGVRLKELMIKKANDTFSKSLQTFSNSLIGSGGSSSAINPLLSNLLPQLAQLPGISPGLRGLGDPIPYLGAITQAVPSLKSVPGLNMLPVDRNGGNPGLNQAISQFAGPLGHIAESGAQPPLQSDVNNLLQSIPNLVVNLPGVGDVDISKLPPSLITHVLKGGSIPGVPQDALNSLVTQHLQRMADLAKAAEHGQVNEMTTKYLPPLGSLSPEIISTVMQSEKLPGLSAEDTNAIKEYYTQSITASDHPSPSPGNVTYNTSGVPVGVPVATLMKVLPPGFDLSRLPPAVLAAAAKGQSPDLSLLPPDLLDLLRKTHPELWAEASAPKVADKQQTLEDLLRNLPTYTRSPNLVTFKPYDINELDEAQTKATQDQKDMAQITMYTAIGLGAVGALTVVVIAVMCYRRRMHNDEDRSSVDVDESELDKTKFFMPKTSSSPKSMTAQFDAIGMDHNSHAGTTMPSSSTHIPRVPPFPHFDPYTGMSRAAHAGPAPLNPLAWSYGPPPSGNSRHYSRTEI